MHSQVETIKSVPKKEFLFRSIEIINLKYWLKEKYEVRNSKMNYYKWQKDEQDEQHERPE